ncbi:MAG: hypothetical protein QM687_14360 [Ferruginibacter sp.]
MKTFILALLAWIAAPLMSQAHTYWFVTEGSHKVNEPVQVKIYFGEYVTGELMSGKSLDKMKDIKVWVRLAGSPDMAIVMTQDTGYWKGSFTPLKEGTYEIIGINDTREVQDWTKHGFGIVRPVQYLKQLYQVGAGATAQSSAAFLDITVAKEHKDYVLQVFKNGKPAGKTKFFISQPDGEEVPVETDETGKAIYKPVAAGLYIVGIEWVDKTPGQFLGKDYASVRYRLDASLQH